MALLNKVNRWDREIIENWWKYSGEKGPVVRVDALVDRTEQLVLI
jgi:hypothetical protein